MNQKSFLEPRDKYDKAIINNKSSKTNYCFYELMDIIIEEISSEGNGDDEELLWDSAAEIFWEELHPQEKTKNISFNFKIDNYYLIKANLPDKTVEYIRSTVYPGKIIYSSIKNAKEAIKKYHDKSFPLGTTFQIEKYKNEHK